MRVAQFASGWAEQEDSGGGDRGSGELDHHAARRTGEMLTEHHGPDQDAGDGLHRVDDRQAGREAAGLIGRHGQMQPGGPSAIRVQGSQLPRAGTRPTTLSNRVKLERHGRGKPEDGAARGGQQTGTDCAAGGHCSTGRRRR